MIEINVYDHDGSLAFELEINAGLEGHDLMNTIEEGLEVDDLFPCRKCGVFFTCSPDGEVGLDDNDYCKECSK